MLSWANRFNIFCFLDNHDYSIAPHSVDCLLAVGQRAAATTLSEADQLAGFWSLPAFGHLSYSLKEELHGQVSGHPDPIGFPHFHFFIPEIMVSLEGNELQVTGSDPEAQFLAIEATEPGHAGARATEVHPLLSREAYLEIIGHLQGHLRRGDCYEINFCQPFLASGATIDPVDVFLRLARLSPTPFAALYRLEERYLLCASPERFLTRRGDRLLSQPMKGTIRRDLLNPQQDENLKDALRASAKDRSENVMVVDLVRNDLTRVCLPGTVEVDELFGVYTYPNVHQMISTVSGRVAPKTLFSEIIGATFPMGSMTGAPKKRVMELIDQYEPIDRGIFSGSVGYLQPNGDFDLNVVIRSIMYNAATGALCYQVGSGITIYSDPEKEWEECLLKAEAIKKVLSGG